MRRFPFWMSSVALPLAICLAHPAAGSSAGVEPSVAVSTVPAVRGSLPDLVEAYGVVSATVFGNRTLSVAEPGRVCRILVGPGEAVRRNAPVLEWEQSSASRLAWDQAKSTMVLAQQQRDHAATLLDRHLATRDQLDQASKALSDARVARDALRRTGADQPFRLLRAPGDGTVTAIPVAQGDYVAAGAPLAVIALGAQTVLAAGVDPARLPVLHPGEPAWITVLDGGASSAGTVLRVGAQLEPQSRLLPVDMSIGAGAPLPGQVARAEIDAGPISGWLVPHAAILQDGAGTVLFQAAGDKAVRVPVSVVTSRGDTDLVRGDLDADHPVVVAGSSQLTDGALLRRAAAGTPP